MKYCCSFFSGGGVPQHFTSSNTTSELEAYILTGSTEVKVADDDEVVAESKKEKKKTHTSKFTTMTKKVTFPFLKMLFNSG